MHKSSKKVIKHHEAQNEAIQHELTCPATLGCCVVLAVSSSLPYEYATSAETLRSRPSCSIHSLGVVVRYGLDAALYARKPARYL